MKGLVYKEWKQNRWLILSMILCGSAPLIVLLLLSGEVSNNSDVPLRIGGMIAGFEKIADMVTFIDKGKILLSGYKDEIIESHGILKCDKEKIKEIDAEDIVSIRTNNFGAEVMVNDRENAGYKYRDCVIDPVSLDDIMLYYVHRDRKEWS